MIDYLQFLFCFSFYSIPTRNSTSILNDGNSSVSFSDTFSLEPAHAIAIFILFVSLLLLSFIALILYIRSSKQEKKRLQNLLEEIKVRERTLNALFENSPVGIVVSDSAGTILSHNKLFLKFFGWDETVGLSPRTFGDIFAEDHLKKFLLVFDELKKEGSKNLANEMSILLHDGTVRWYYHICSRFENEFVEEDTFLHIFSDITERKDFESKLKREEEQYRTYVELSNDAIWCFEATEPIPISLPVEEQMQLMFEKGFLAECNMTFANFYGFENPLKARGVKLSNIISAENPTKIALLHSFIENGYKLDGFLTTVQDTQGNDIYLRNTLFGIIEQDCLVRAWGAFQNVTELVNLKNKYQEVAKKYRDLINNINSVVLHVNLDGRILFINEYGLKLFGYEADELIGKNVVGTIVPLQESSTGRDLSKLMQEIFANVEQNQYVENENIRKDGTRVWISWKNTPIYSKDGNYYEVLSVGIDITDRKKAEIELQNTWDLIFALMDALPDAVCFKDAEGRWIYANKVMLKLFNLEGKEFKGKTDAELIYFDESYRSAFETCIESDRKTWEKKTTAHYEETIASKDGRENIYDVVKVPIFNSDGTKRGLAVLGRNVTIQKIALGALQESEERYRKLVEGLPLPTLVLHNEDVIFANRPAKNIFQKLNKSVDDYSISVKRYFTGDNFDKLMEIIRNPNQRTEPSQIAIDFEGEERQFNVSSVPILFGGKDSFLLVLNDITEQKRYSEYLEKLSKELQQQKIELEKINQELAEKNRELKELNSTKDKFFSIITHDLKNPIYGVKSLVSEFNASFDVLNDVEKREFISAIFSSTSKLADLLESLLLWSRTQTRTLPYNPTEVNIKYLVEDTISFHYQNAKQKDIVILQRLEENATAYADVGCVTTILRNLISNAIKFTGQGGVIHISSETIEEDGAKYEKIAVADNGIGIPYEVRDRLLRLDFQHTSLGTSGERGTGLGLIIIKELVELNGGKIWFESELNKGSTFYFTLPKKEDGQ